MKSVDTNVVVRVITTDDLVQTPLAIAAFENPVFVSHGVLMETEWVLRSRYRWPRQQIARALCRLLEVRTVHVNERALLDWCLNRYADGADLADMLHLVASRGLDAFISFEANLDRDAGPHTPTPVERLQ